MFSNKRKKQKKYTYLLTYTVDIYFAFETLCFTCFISSNFFPFLILNEKKNSFGRKKVGNTRVLQFCFLLYII